MRDFKAKMVEHILRRTLKNLHRVTKRQKYVRRVLTKLFRDKTRTLARLTLTQWLVQAQRQRLVKFECLVLCIKRGGRTKKLIWKVLVRNAR